MCNGLHSVSICLCLYIRMLYICKLGCVCACVMSVRLDVFLCMVNCMVFGDRQTCVQTIGLTSVNLSFLLCAMGLIMPVSQDYCVVLLRSLVPRK